MRYLEGRVTELFTQLRQKEDVIQSLLHEGGLDAYLEKIASLEELTRQQQEELVAKEEVIQQFLRAKDADPKAPTTENAPLSEAKRIILGAATTTFPGWLSTDKDTLDVTDRRDFEAMWTPGSCETFLAEHVWEHLDDTESHTALTNCYSFLGPGGRLRIAVPDAFHPDPTYQQWARPGGIGPGADDHKKFYHYRSISEAVERAGFEVQLLEYWDENGRFHYRVWNWEDGPVLRSSRHDSRNLSWPNAYTSLIIDGIKPA